MVVKLQETYKAQESRIKQEVLRRNVLRVLRIWRSWFIFSDDFINGLQVMLQLTTISWLCHLACFVCMISHWYHPVQRLFVLAHTPHRQGNRYSLAETPWCGR